VASTLPFEQRACFVAGQAKSGTTLLVALLDNHPELLVLPEETAYFPTVLTKYAPRGRRAQFDYLTKQSLSNVLFGGPCKWGKRNYATFPREKFLETFEGAAFDPANARKDLLVLMVKAYAATLERPLDTIGRWVEKTPANRNHIPEILRRFPHAKILVTMRDPRAILAAQIALEKTRQTGRFSTYYVIAHWLVAAGLARRVRDGEISTRKRYSHRRRWAGFGVATQQPGSIFRKSVQNRQRAGSVNCPKTRSDGWNGIVAISCQNSATSQNYTDASYDHLCVQFVASAQGSTSNRAPIRCVIKSPANVSTRTAKTARDLADGAWCHAGQLACSMSF
jgi:hypothetical protein